MVRRPFMEVISGAAYSLSSCAFVWAYTAIKVGLWRHYGAGGSLSALCELLLPGSTWAFAVPILGPPLALFLYKKGMANAPAVIAEGLRIAAFCWVLFCLVIWEVQGIPRASLRGIM
jgi:hypothetical protein